MQLQALHTAGVPLHAVTKLITYTCLLMRGRVVLRFACVHAEQNSRAHRTAVPFVKQQLQQQIRVCTPCSGVIVEGQHSFAPVH